MGFKLYRWDYEDYENIAMVLLSDNTVALI